MPLYSGGLWLAEICTPPAARWTRTSTPSVGVAAMPASSTSRLATRRPLVTAPASIGPLARPSRLTMIGPGGKVAAKAVTYRAATSGVRLSPTMPRRPETEMMGSVTGLLIRDKMKSLTR